MFGLSLSQMLPKSFTLKNGLVVLCKHIEDHENVKHEVKKFELRVNTITKAFDVLIWHPGTKKPTYTNDIFEDGLYYPVKYERPGHSHLYHYNDGAFIIGLIEDLIKREVNTKDNVDFVLLKYDDSQSEVPCEIFVTNSAGEKLKIKHIIK